MYYDPQVIQFTCTYLPCGHVETVNFLNKESVDTSKRLCPKCNLFTLEYIPPLLSEPNVLAEIVRDTLKEHKEQSK